MRNYIITLYDPDDWDIFNDEMVKTCAHPFVPYRKVVCTNYMPVSDKQAFYELTDDEANKIAKDPRVELIELHPDERDDIQVGTTATQSAKFTKSGTLTFEYKNWALLRCTNRTNPFAVSQTLTDNYNYTLTGKGVDIFIADTGVAEGHPELAVNPDGTGGSRVVDYDWTQLGVGVSSQIGSGTKGFLGDCRGHGSNCASIAAGNTCGWARDARIYTYRCIPSGNNIDIVTGKTLSIGSPSNAFYLAKAFHLSKPIDPTTGYRRPTIMSNSWTYYTSYYMTADTYTNWRGTNYPTPSINPAYGQVSSTFGSKVASIDTAMAEAMEAGVIVVAAAGNEYHNIDIPGGIDYNNYYFTSTSTAKTYYHRGSTPGATVATTASGLEWKSISVGALENTTIERKASFSNTGRRVDIYAPGRYIIGAGSTNYSYIDDPRNPIYKLSSLSGTSMACPQVTGMLACVAQARPWMNQNDALNWLVSNAIVGAMDENLVAGETYTNNYYLQGSPNRILYTPYNSSITVNTSGDIKIQATAGAL